jgi:hypothetical protein
MFESINDEKFTYQLAESEKNVVAVLDIKQDEMMSVSRRFISEGKN